MPERQQSERVKSLLQEVGDGLRYDNPSRFVPLCYEGLHLTDSELDPQSWRSFHLALGTGLADRYPAVARRHYEIALQTFTSEEHAVARDAVTVLIETLDKNRSDRLGSSPRFDWIEQFESHFGHSMVAQHTVKFGHGLTLRYWFWAMLPAVPLLVAGLAMLLGLANGNEKTVIAVAGVLCVLTVSYFADDLREILTISKLDSARFLVRVFTILRDRLDAFATKALAGSIILVSLVGAFRTSIAAAISLVIVATVISVILGIVFFEPISSARRVRDDARFMTDEWRDSNRSGLKAAHREAASILAEHQSSGQPYALFLRNFDMEIEEEVRLHPTESGPQNFIVRRENVAFEENLGRALKDHFPIIAAANPKMHYRSDGVPKLSITEEKWEKALDDVVSGASLIVLFVGRLTLGVSLEAEMILANDKEAETIVVLSDAAHDQLAYELFLDLRRLDAGAPRIRIVRESEVCFDNIEHSPSIGNLIRDIDAKMSKYRTAQSDMLRESKLEQSELE